MRKPPVKAKLCQRHSCFTVLHGKAKLCFHWRLWLLQSYATPCNVAHSAPRKKTKAQQSFATHNKQSITCHSVTKVMPCHAVGTARQSFAFTFHLSPEVFASRRHAFAAEQHCTEKRWRDAIQNNVFTEDCVVRNFREKFRKYFVRKLCHVILLFFLHAMFLDLSSSFFT